MFLICRKNSGATLNISCQGPCEEFVRTYIKYNVAERDKENFVLLKAEELNIEDYMPVEASTESETKASATSPASAEPREKKKVAPEKKTADVTTN